MALEALQVPEGPLRGGGGGGVLRCAAGAERVVVVVPARSACGGAERLVGWVGAAPGSSEPDGKERGACMPLQPSAGQLFFGANAHVHTVDAGVAV